MKVQDAYNSWAATYDAVANKTRDLEAKALHQLLGPLVFSTVLEIGCGTGKNTEWLAARATQVVAVDFSVAMLEAARAKVIQPNVTFIQADITTRWDFVTAPANLVTCSLILEHVPTLDFVFQQASLALQPAGYFYVGELHPFKQYQGSQARFEAAAEVIKVDAFTHHMSDYMVAAKRNGLICVELHELFDDADKNSTPRIVAFLFQKL
jgi:ubiquinone/menaquinone biosynthesis C-methylase UbiE